MSEKSFRFKPSDYKTDFQTIQQIHRFGVVAKIGDEVAVTYSADWQLISLFVQIGATETTLQDEPQPKITGDKPNIISAFITALILSALNIWLYFF